MSDSTSRQDKYDASFPIPISGLFADLEMGVGALNLPNEFFEVSPAIQIEILTDWQRGMLDLRNAALVNLYEKLAVALGDRPDGEKLECFRETCRNLDIEVPGNFGSILERSRQK